MKFYSDQGHLFFEDVYAAAQTGLSTMKALEHKPSEQFREQASEILRRSLTKDSDRGYLPALFHQSIVWFVKTAELLNLPMQGELAESAVSAICNKGRRFLTAGFPVNEAQIMQSKEWMLKSISLIIGEERANAVRPRLDVMIHSKKSSSARPA